MESLHRLFLQAAPLPAMTASVVLGFRRPTPALPMGYASYNRASWLHSLDAALNVAMMRGTSADWLLKGNNFVFPYDPDLVARRYSSARFPLSSEGMHLRAQVGAASTRGVSSRHSGTSNRCTRRSCIASTVLAC
jgi:hypothetical protein